MYIKLTKIQHIYKTKTKVFLLVVVNCFVWKWPVTEQSIAYIYYNKLIA